MSSSLHRWPFSGFFGTRSDLAWYLIKTINHALISGMDPGDQLAKGQVPQSAQDFWTELGRTMLLRKLDEVYENNDRRLSKTGSISHFPTLSGVFWLQERSIRRAFFNPVRLVLLQCPVPHRHGRHDTASDQRKGTFYALP